MNLIRVLLSLVFLGLFSSSTLALEKKVVCTWDPVGMTGPVMSFVDDVIPVAIEWGLELHFEVYSDELLAVKDLEEGRCDMSIVTAISSRSVVSFGGTLDAMGAVTSQEELRQVLAAITSPKATDMLTDGDYEMVLALPVGAMYAYVNDRRKISSIDDLREKRVAVINNDVQVARLAQFSQAIAVPETLSTFSNSFNYGKIDVIVMPATAFDAFELYKGIGHVGGVLDIPMFYGMIQGISRQSSFPDKFGEQMRKWMLSRFDVSMAVINRAEAAIPKHYWVRTPKNEKDSLREFYKEIRLALMAENRLNPQALSLLWKIRCISTPDLEECQQP